MRYFSLYALIYGLHPVADMKSRCFRVSFTSWLHEIASKLIQELSVAVCVEVLWGPKRGVSKP